MDNKREPDPRWEQFEEVFDENQKTIGFHLPGNQFLFTFDEDGGWEDQKGNYFNAEGILQDSQHSQADELDDDQFSGHDDDLVDEFEQILREEEEGINRKTIKDKEPQVNIVKQTKTSQKEHDFNSLVEKYIKQDKVRQGLPSQLFIYFKQKSSNYESIKPLVQFSQSVQQKKKAVQQIKKQIAEKRNKLIESNQWLKQQGVFLDYSGDSQQTSKYDRYWYGYFKTSADKYLDSITKINTSEQFKILQIKTYYSLKSKFYLKKSEQIIKKTINEMRQKITPLTDNQTVSFLFDNLPEQFPCSFVYDLIEYAGGHLVDVQSVVIQDDFSATVTILKRTALLAINLQGFTHDKGQYIQISINETKERAYPQGKHIFYYITVDSEFKVHERQLNDTLALLPQKTELSKIYSKEQQKKTKVRFVVGSIEALRKVLMFRGETLNTVQVNSTQPK